MDLKSLLYYNYCIVLTILISRFYCYEIPYQDDGFDELFSTIPFLVGYIALALVATLPLFYHQKKGILGLILLLAITAKPLIIEEHKRQSVFDFLEEREVILLGYIENNVKPKSWEMYGIHSVRQEGDSFIFMVNGLLDNSYGLVYDRDNKITGDLFDEVHWSTKPIKPNWFEFTTT